jgi:hypothetical protein
VVEEGLHIGGVYFLLFFYGKIPSAFSVGENYFNVLDMMTGQEKSTVRSLGSYNRRCWLGMFAVQRIRLFGLASALFEGGARAMRI